jgi:hypothetical protein
MQDLYFDQISNNKNPVHIHIWLESTQAPTQNMTSTSLQI